MRVRLQPKLKPNNYTETCMIDEADGWRGRNVWYPGRPVWKHYKVLYMNLLTSGKLHSYLAEVDKQAEDMFLRLVKEYADRQDVTEQLKKDNPYEWIGRMNNIQACVREVVGTELIYT